MISTSSRKDMVEATVTNVIHDGRYSYAVAIVTGVSGTITFSLHPDRKIWLEEEYPVPGNSVILQDLRKSSRGWRAYQARFLQLSDEGQ